MANRIKITKMMYGWSKWGGATHGLVKEELDEWYCQTCGELQAKELPAYMVSLDDSNRDFIRVCSKCKNTSKNNGITDHRVLIRVVTKRNL